MYIYGFSKYSAKIYIFFQKTLLHYASFHGFKEIVKLIINYPAIDVNIADEIISNVNSFFLCRIGIF